ncbi:MAG: LLM class flavin-dependent oxidoreductase [Proteobacteria bacterium]|nr:LLM class flavin-dependent oxidoreductase [Pseudomonadota bacterium]HQR04407.1 LLM class flavin-dependent oxidoreductase [Rhodocyclaceae bacterium]
MTSPVVQIRFDMRTPALGQPAQQLYEAALDMAEFADHSGVHIISLSEHHGVEEGYLSSSPTLAAAMAARTRQIRIHLSAIVLPLHDPLHLAEQIAVLDLISGGRVTLVAAGGYVQAEFDMFDRQLSQRAALVEEAITTLRQAWTGEYFDYRGRRVRVTPRPAQVSVPIFMGGSVPAAARRAGRLADGFITHLPDLYAIYEASARSHGKNPAPFPIPTCTCVYVAENPDQAWEWIAPHALYEMNSYGRWTAAAGTDGGYSPVSSIAELKASGAYAVMTPEECVTQLRTAGSLFLHPLVGGLSPEIGWRSLRLFAEKVMPAL